MADNAQSAISRLMHLYALAVDSRGWDLLDRIFTDDVDADYGEGSHWRSLTALKTDFANNHSHLTATQHGIMNLLVDDTEERAHAFCYCRWRYLRKGVSGGEFMGGLSWYDDQLVSLPQGWRIRKRVCRLIWWDGNPSVAREDVRGAQWEPQISSLAAETRAGRIAFPTSQRATRKMSTQKR